MPSQHSLRQVPSDTVSSGPLPVSPRKHLGVDFVWQKGNWSLRKEPTGNLLRKYIRFPLSGHKGGCCLFTVYSGSLSVSLSGSVSYVNETRRRREEPGVDGACVRGSPVCRLCADGTSTSRMNLSSSCDYTWQSGETAGDKNIPGLPRDCQVQVHRVFHLKHT